MTEPAGDRRLGTSVVDREVWAYFMGFYRRRLHRLLAYGGVAAVQATLVVPILYLVRVAFDRAIPQSNVPLLAAIGAGVLGARLANSGMSLWLRKANLKLIKDATLELREDLLVRLYSFSRTLYTQLDRNTTHARLVQDTERLDAASNEVASRLLPSLFTSIPLLSLLAVMNWRLLLVMSTFLPILVLTTRLTSRRVRQRVFTFHRSFERYSKGVYFVLQHMDLTRMQSHEAAEIDRQRGHLRNVRDTSERMAFSYAVHGQAQTAVISLGGAILLVVGGAAVARHSMTLGELLAFWVAAGLLYSQLNTIMRAIPEVITGFESITTLSEFAHAQPLRPYRGKRAVPFTGTLRLESASFDYGQRPILSDVNLTISRGDRIAIIGPNGAGKSTLLALLLGFYRPHQGRLLADEVSYDEIDVVKLRRSIGVVPQNPDLFSGTILENLTYGNPNVGEAEIVCAARIALADEFIRDLPDGYANQVGEGGVLLSRGQVQRLAIARALVRRPALIVLDEPTNHLDQDAIERLMANLDHLDPPPARLVISHDPQVIRHAATTFEIRDGRLHQHSGSGAVPAMG